MDELHWLDQPIHWLYWTGLHVTGWKLIGYTGALMFGARWLVQFIATRRAGKPVIRVASARWPGPLFRRRPGPR